MRLMLALVILPALAAPALASDGVLEINQACAVNTGCFAGDVAGLPVTITASGSYRLTSNLSVQNENTDGIAVTASNVSIHLGGFSILGPNQCSAPPVACSHAGTGFGIHIQADRAHVSSGSIVGLGSVGIYAEPGGDGHEILDLRVANNRYEGIRIDGAAGRVKGVTAIRNGGIGILIGERATVSDNTAHQNGNIGIMVGAGSSVSTNTVSDNGADGISAGIGSRIQQNTIRYNVGWGLVLETYATYRENTITTAPQSPGGVTGSGAINNNGENFCAGSGTMSRSCP